MVVYRWTTAVRNLPFALVGVHILRMSLSTAGTDNHDLMMKDPLLSLLRHLSLLQLCRRAPHFPTKTPDIITLLSQIQTSRWSTVWTCRAEDREEPLVIKRVPEGRSECMIWGEFYMYEGGHTKGVFPRSQVSWDVPKTYRRVVRILP